jgi:Antibiotic biosynthesis monooxygenase
MRHFRVALYDVTSGSAEEVIEIAREGFLPIFEEQPGFVRYEVGELDNGGIASFSIWETGSEAQRAVELAAEFVRDNLSTRVRLREEHTGDIAWDDPA